MSQEESVGIGAMSDFRGHSGLSWETKYFRSEGWSKNRTSSIVSEIAWGREIQVHSAK